MDNTSFNKSVSNSHFSGSKPVTREMLQARARELALIAGRAPVYVSQMDYEQAKRELPGNWDLDQQETPLDSSRQEQPNKRVPNSTGHQLPESPNEDEDNEGRSETEQRVMAGVKKAGRDQILQAAALQTEKKDI